MLQFRDHWLEQETLEQFKVDINACLQLPVHTGFLAYLLNANLSCLETVNRRGSLWMIIDCHLKRGVKLEELRAVQLEALSDVDNLIDDRTKLRERDLSLFPLVDKINAMRLSTQWEVKSGGKTSTHFIFPPPTKARKPSLAAALYNFRHDLIARGLTWGLENAPKEVEIRKKPNPNLNRLGRGQAKLNLGNANWIVERSLMVPSHFREEVYCSLIMSLEDGSFSLFGRCPQCSLFFVGDDRKQKYCSKECAKKFTNSDSRNRQEEYRKRLAENQHALVRLIRINKDCHPFGFFGGCVKLNAER